MELSYEEVSKWLDEYFKGVNKNQGTLEKVVRSKKYFTADFQFLMYTKPPFVKFPSSREDLLLLFVHPGLYEKLTPKYYVIDVKRMIAVVQFELQFIDEKTGAVCTPPLLASAHYHLAFENNGLKIKKIQYWTEAAPPGAIEDMIKLWIDSKDRELADLAVKYINAQS
jgi:hypothetical protein